MRLTIAISILGKTFKKNHEHLETLGQRGSFCPFYERHKTYNRKLGSKREFQFESTNSQQISTSMTDCGQNSF